MHKTLIQEADYQDPRRVVEKVFETFPLDIAHKKVLIKPNVLRASLPEEGIVTHPALLRAVVDRVESMGPASIIVGDNPGLFDYGANERSFEKTGLAEAAKGYYLNIGIESEKVDFNPDFMERVSLSRAVLDADIIISLPKFKTHGLTVITGAIKNCYGYLPGAQKARLHKIAGNPESFHQVIVDVFKLRPPDLFIMDAVVGMEGNGPASPDLRRIGLVLASDNAVALDGLMASMIGCDPGKIRFLKIARQSGLGSYDLDDMEILGKFKKIPDYKIPPLGGEAILENETIQELFHSRPLLKPEADPESCTACETCVDQCCVSALSMENGLPVVDADTCITCFCCQEICPEKAITLK
jgi:uncharacterized protein (DUF362 family)/Pyruvate/2-oxoacid:ferredoxin oxidoreductase delta subunit